MKTKTFLTVACFIAMAHVASAFGFNITANDIGQDLGTKTVFVPGYGNVTFSGVGASVLTYHAAPPFGNIRFDDGESMLVTFDSGPVSDFKVISEAPSGAVFTTLETTPGTGQTTMYITSTRDSGNVLGVSFVPEPSTALLGVLGMGFIVLRRRR